MSSHTSRHRRTTLSALTYAHKVFEALDTPVSLACSLLLKYGEHEQLVRKKIDPLCYRTASAFFHDYQSVKLLSKYPYLDTKINTKEVARQKFHESERLCQLTNERFRSAQTSPFSAKLERVLYNARAKIASILGSTPNLEDMDFSFGPGAAYGVRGETSPYNKVVATLECTYAFTGVLQNFLEEFPGWIPEGIHDVVIIQGSQLTFVPKDAKTDRPICIEPLLNGMYQKGVGSYIRKRLKRFGVNLDDQSVNQRLAGCAHEQRLATVDFSSASDTIAYLLVLDLLPIDWFEFLDVARCPQYNEDGVWKSFHKFSSMGNAYTFELESLIFYALAYACVEEVGIRPQTGVNLSVYGDDVIIPQEAFDLYQEVTEICGFEISRDKSYASGVFFESCGQDFFNGVLVRPFFLKLRLNTLLQSFYATNTIARLADRLPTEGVSLREAPAAKPPAYDRLRAVHSYCISTIPNALRAYGPEGFGDGHIIVSVDACRPTRHSTWDGWCIRTYVEEPIKVKLDEYPMAYALYNTRHQGAAPAAYLGWDTVTVDNGSGYAVRGRTRVKKRVLFVPSEWKHYPLFSNHTAN